MSPVVLALLAFFGSLFQSRRAMHLKILALQHQVAVYQHSVHRPRLRPPERLFWSWLSLVWSGWQDALQFVQPSTVIAWQKRRFRDHWRRLSQQGKPGRPTIAKDIKTLIRHMSQANPTWGAPRIIGELQKLGLNVAKSTVEKYRVRPKKPPSPTWKTFLNSHVKELVALDFFVVPTVTHKVLFVLLIIGHHRRRVIHINVTVHPTAEWTAQRVVEAFPWDEAPPYLLRDRDHIYGPAFRQRVRNLGITEVLSAPYSPWQYPPRMFGAYDRTERAASKGYSEPIFRLLSSLAHASVTRHGLSGTTTGTASRCPSCRWHVGES